MTGSETPDHMPDVILPLTIKARPCTVRLLPRRPGVGPMYLSSLCFLEHAMVCEPETPGQAWFPAVLMQPTKQRRLVCADGPPREIRASFPAGRKRSA